jgi:LmbE family N-acetylglucosaminyl deacetylase
MPTVVITTTVDVRDVLEAKRAAMAAHASQIPETASAMRLPTEAFAAVYGYEWFVRRGPRGPLDKL